MTRLSTLSAAIGSNPSRYDDADFWGSIGDNELDDQLTLLADMFASASDADRATIRSSVHPNALWNLIAYVRRMALPVLRERDAKWLERGLFVAAIEDGRFDFRDLIVSLVILRAASEQIGLDCHSYFNYIIEHCSLSSVGTFANARDHSPSNVSDLLQSFGPPELLPKC